MIFKVNESKSITRNEQEWVQIGLEWNQAKKEGITIRQFTSDRGIAYSTFTKSMSRYKDQIQIAIQARDLIKSKKRLTTREKQILIINSFRSTIKRQVATGGTRSAKKSQEWFTDTLKKGIRSHKVTKPSTGRLYAYMYDAKHKDTLPHWDVFPLIICLGYFSTISGEVLMRGLNLHYVPPKARQQFLEELLRQYATTKTITNSTELKIDWSKVKGFKGADKMIKSYIPSRIKGSVMEIKPADWANVVMLPLQRFVSQGKPFSTSGVWYKK